MTVEDALGKAGEEPRVLYDLATVAPVVGVAARRLRTAAASGEMYAVKLSGGRRGTWYVRPEWVDKWIDEKVDA